MKIAVCGDSFCAAPKIAIKAVGSRAHFSQILEDIYGYKIIHLAHGGMSNTGIWFQIREAIKLRPRAIVYNQTWSSRVELMSDLIPFNLSKGLRNFAYTNDVFESTGTPLVGTKQSATVFSTVWQGLADNPFIQISSEQIHAIDSYLKHLYNDEMHTEIDSWMFEYWHGKIEKAGILPLRFNDADIGKPAYDFYEQNGRQIIDCPFHTDRITQQIIAENVHKRICQTIDKSLTIL